MPLPSDETGPNSLFGKMVNAMVYNYLREECIKADPTALEHFVDDAFGGSFSNGYTGLRRDEGEIDEFSNGAAQDREFFEHMWGRHMHSMDKIISKEFSMHCIVLFINDFIKADFERLRDELKTGNAKAALSIPDGFGGLMGDPHTEEVTAIQVRKLSDPAYVRVLVEKKLATVLENLNSKGKFKDYFGNVRDVPITAMSPAQARAYNSHPGKVSAQKIMKIKKAAIEDDFHVKNMLKQNCFYPFKGPSLEIQEQKRFNELVERFAVEDVKKVTKENILAIIRKAEESLLKAAKIALKNGTWHIQNPNQVPMVKDWYHEEFGRTVDGKEYRLLVWEKLQDPTTTQKVLNRRVAEMVAKFNKHKNFKGWFDDYDPEIAAFYESADHEISKDGIKPSILAAEFFGPLMKINGNERAAVFGRLMRTEAQRAYKAKKRNEKKKAKKAEARAATREKSEEVVEKRAEENSMPAIENLELTGE